MLRSPRRAAGALTTAVVLFAASTQSQHCVHYNSSGTAGTPENVSIAFPTYSSCSDDGFLIKMEAHYLGQEVEGMRWTCSAPEDVSSTSSSNDSFYTASLSFTVGITHVSTRVKNGSFPQLSNMYFGGYDVDSSGDYIIFSWKGPFGDIDDESEFLPDRFNSWCDSGSFATGMTAWGSFNYVYGARLECANVTTACAPLGYPASLLANTSEPTTSPTTPYPSTLPLTAPPSVAANPVATIDPASSSSGGSSNTETPTPSRGGSSDTETPRPSGGGSSGTETPSPSVNIASTSESSASSANTIVIGASVAGGLFCLALGAGVTCCFYRRKERKIRQPDTPRNASGTPAAMSGGEGVGGFAPEEGAVTHAVYATEAAAPAPPTGSPPPYSDVPRYRTAPPPYP